MYDKKLIKHLQETSPDLIVLAGWMRILGDSFLKAMRELEITVINLHPALMTEKFEKTVPTSQGSIPVLRGQGKHIFKEIFEKNFPVTGVTIHQILPGDTFDVGPIILKAEVRRHKDDTVESWEKRIHATEYILLPTAIKRVLHVMKQNIDISKGKFPW
jgi:folate-dependent phosphoribosylglycinamide formyltransferase PurN